MRKCRAPRHRVIFCSSAPAYTPLVYPGVLVLTDPTTALRYLDSSSNMKASCWPCLSIREGDSADVEVLGVSADTEYGGPDASLRQRVEAQGAAGARRLVEMARLADQSDAFRSTAGHMSCNGSTMATSPSVDKGLLGMSAAELSRFFGVLTDAMARAGQEHLSTLLQGSQRFSLAVSGLGPLGETCMSRQHFEGSLYAAGGA